MADLTINDLPSAAQLDGTEEVAVYQNGETLKALISSILALAGSGNKVVTGTLSAGSTSITLQDASITGSSLLAPFTEVYGVNPTNMVASTGSVTLTFEALQSNLGVAVVIIGGAS